MGTVVGPTLGDQFQEAAILSMSHRASLVIYLDVFMGYSDPTLLTFMWSLPLCIPPCHPKTPPNKDSSRCLRFAGCLTLKPAQAPGYDPHRTPVVSEGSLRPDYGSGFSRGEEKLSILLTATKAVLWLEPSQDAFKTSKTKLCTYKQ